jgi:hypothetical protein
MRFEASPMAAATRQSLSPSFVGCESEGCVSAAIGPPRSGHADGG